MVADRLDPNAPAVERAMTTARKQNGLALAFSEGMGVTRQPEKAVEVYQKACDGGYKLACRNLGLMLREGRGSSPIQAATRPACSWRSLRWRAPG